MKLYEDICSQNMRDHSSGEMKLNLLCLCYSDIRVDTAVKSIIQEFEFCVCFRRKSFMICLNSLKWH